MIMSEKQIMQLMRIANAYIAAMHQIEEYKQVEAVMNLLIEINDQQSEELKEIK